MSQERRTKKMKKTMSDSKYNANIERFSLRLILIKLFLIMNVRFLKRKRTNQEQELKDIVN